MSARRIFAIVLRYSYGSRHDMPRLFDIFYWPIIDLLVWGFLTVYLNERRDTGALALSWLIGGIIFWTLLYRSSQDVAVQLLEDVWARNLPNLFASPLRLSEFVVGLVIVACLKVLVTFVVIAVLALLLYAFDITTLGPYLLPFVLILFLFGWAMGLIVAGLIIRYGSRIQIMAWGAAYLIQPVSAVFYPVETLPPPLQPIAWANPATYVFEGMRAVLLTGRFDTALWLAALAMAGGSMALSAWLFALLFDRARAKGLLARLD
jgi:ABC-2 type transport system permease protein